MSVPVSRLAKLAAMRPHELMARTAYKSFLAYERGLHAAGLLSRPDRLRKGLVPALARSKDWQRALVTRPSAPRFFPSADSPASMRALFEDRYRDERTKASGIAGRVSDGRIGFFGRQFSFGTEIDWHADPVTGAVWPRRYHSDLLVHGGNFGFGDVKDVWELNRHQFFVDLAKVAFLEGSHDDAATLHRLLRHWMSEVPYATGVPWACALEPAFRVWSWLWAYHLVRAAHLLDETTHLSWLTGFYDHGRFLHRHLETYSSLYNHLIGEASALFALGLLFPEFHEANAWLARGRRVLESTVCAQFHPDGGSVEQSTFYHHATLGFYLLAAILGRRNGVELSRNVWSAIERGIEFSAALVQPDGRLPRIGGADDGKPIRLEHLPFWDFRPYQAVGAVLFSRPDFKFVAGRFWEDAAWLLGAEGLQLYDQLEAREPSTSAALPASGYYVARSNWSRDADYLCMDCGEQAAGLRRDDVPSAAHGHADCLAVVLMLGGREVLVDPGFFCYNGDPEWEVHFRKTAAHNTVVVNGRDQARHISKMAWTRTYRAVPEAWSADHQLAFAGGSHDGYMRDAGGVVHRRTAWLRSDGYLILRDELTGTSGQMAEAVFQFAAGQITPRDSSVLFEHRFELVWACSAPVRARVTCGGNGPSEGWIATSLGVRAAAPRLVLEFPMNSERVVLLTVVADTERCRVAAAPGTAVSTDNGLLRARISGGEWSDEVVAAAVSATSAEIDSDAPLVVLRRINGRLATALQAGGSFVRATSPSATSEQGARPHAVMV